MSDNLWIFGCITSVVGSVLSNLGVNVQKYSLTKNAKLPELEQLHHCKQPLWFLGFLFVIFGALADFGALSMAAQSIVAPIGSVTLVANIFFAYFWLHEKLSMKDLGGTFLVVLGSVLSVAFGNHEDVEYTMSDIKYFYGQPAFLAYLFITIFMLVGCYFLARYLEPIRDDLLLAYVAYDEAQSEQDVDKMKQYKKTIAILNKVYEPYQKMHPLAYCCISGLIGAFSVLQAKSVSILLRVTFQGDNQFTNILTYVFLFLMVITIVIQTNYLAIALKYFDALYVVPVFQCFWISGSTIGGALFYQELKTFNSLQWAMFPLGVLITLCGVALLSLRDMTRKMEAEEEILHRVSVSKRMSIALSIKNKRNSVINFEKGKGSEFTELSEPEVDEELKNFEIPPEMPVTMKTVLRRKTAANREESTNISRAPLSPIKEEQHIEDAITTFAHVGLIRALEDTIKPAFAPVTNFTNNLAHKVAEKLHLPGTETSSFELPATRARARTRMDEIKNENENDFQPFPNFRRVGEIFVPSKYTIEAPNVELHSISVQDSKSAPVFEKQASQGVDGYLPQE